MKKIVAAIVLITSLSCNTGRYATASRIGLVNLENYYAVQAKISDADDYLVITNEDAFDAAFSADESAGDNLKYPDFKGQVVVAVQQPLTAYTSVHLSKADITGNTMNIYAESVNESKAAGNNKPAAVATVPKSLNVKAVSFYVDGNKVKTIIAPLRKEVRNAAYTLAPAKVTVKRTGIRRPAII